MDGLHYNTYSPDKQYIDRERQIKMHKNGLWWWVEHVTCDRVEGSDEQQENHGDIDVQIQGLVDENGPRKHVCLRGVEMEGTH